MLSTLRLTREQELLGAHANHHAPRHTLPPLAPRPARHTICGRLPSFSNLVKDHRQRLSLPELHTTSTFKDNLKQYEIDGKFYVMETVEHEKVSSFQRVTAEGRRLTYQLEVVQAPIRARACGNGPRSSADRRPVDPPPVVRLTVHHDKTDITASYQANFMLFASLEFSRPIAPGRGMPQVAHCPVLTGVCVAGAAYLAKPQAAAYFIFADLSVRHEGWYRLKFHLFEQNKRREDLDADVARALANETSGYEGPISSEQMVNRMHVSTSPFQVYSAKKFPGLQESTIISQQMADQGIRVRIRREIRQRTDKSRKHSDKPDDEQRSIRASSHDRVPGMDSYAYPSESHRASVDQSRAPSRQQSYNPSVAASPMTTSPTTAHPYPGYNTIEPVAPHSAEPWQHSYDRSNSQASTQSIPRPQAYRSGSTNLPSIASMINNFPAPEPARPQGGYYSISSPATKKRALNNRGEDTAAALKDRARPSLTPISRTPTVPSWSAKGATFDDASKRPLAPGEDLIEADDDESDDSGEDTILNPPSSLLHSYKRAAGGYGHVPRL